MSEGKNCAIRLSDCCYRISRWFPIIVVDVIVLWSYYAYVVQFCFFCVESPYEKIAYLAVFHVAFVLVCLSYWRTTFTHPGEVPDSFQFPQQELSLQHDANNVDLMNERLEEMVRNTGVKTRTATGDVRYCERCQVIKPDRAHHCSACGKCILKMDHHCPWINNCVGFNNYKFFMLFLIYGVVYCIFIGGTLLMYCIKFWKQQLSNKWQVYILFFFAVMILVSLAPLFFYHCFLLLDNRTTLEAFRSPVFQHGVDRDAFNLGRCKNFKEVFGENCLLWFLPVASTPGDGVHFPLRIHSSSTTYNTVERGDSNFKRNVGYGEVKRIYHQDLGYIPQ